MNAFRIMLAAALASGALALEPSAQAANLLRNNGFEAPTSTDWTQENTNWFTGGGAFRTDWQKYAGNYALGIPGSWSGSTSGGFEQKAPVTNGHRYAVSFFYFWDNEFQASQRSFSAHWYDATAAWLASHEYDLNLVGAQSNWCFSGWYPLRAPDGAARLEIKLDIAGVGGGGVLYLDEFALEDCGTALDSFLANGTWETPPDQTGYGNWRLAGNAIHSDWQKHAGQYAVGFCGRWWGAQTQCLARQCIAVTGSHVYATDFWHFWDNDFTCAVRQFSVEWKNSAGVGLGTNLTIVLTNGAQAQWHLAGPFTVTAPVAAAAAVIQYRCAGMGTSGVYYLDDITWRDQSAAGPAFFRRQGTNIVDGQGQPFLIRGEALSGWLSPEPYMLQISGDASGRVYSTHTRLRNQINWILKNRAEIDLFWNTYNSNFVTESDIQFLADEGCNTLRIPLNFRDLSPQNNEGAFLPDTFALLDRVIGWCRARGLRVILDLHVCPGGQAPETSGDPEYLQTISNQEHGVECLWVTNAAYTTLTGRTPESNRRRTADIWRELARHFRTNEYVMGYELINEPHLPAITWSNLLRATFVQISSAIREVDTNHLLFVEGDMFAERIDGLLPMWDGNTGIAVHRYWRETGYQDGWVQTYLDARAAHQVPFWLSEAGENSSPWYHDVARLFESNRIGWTWWGWKKVDSISCALSVSKSTNYQYVIDHLWSSNVNPVLFRAGLMALADAVKFTNCTLRKEWPLALFDTNGRYNTATTPYTNHTLPCAIQLADYDIGTIHQAYYDTDYWATNYPPAAWNRGWGYRNNGVDVVPLNSGGYYVGYNVAGEWVRYTIQVVHGSRYDIRLNVSSPDSAGKVAVYLDETNALTGVINIPHTGGWENWSPVTISNCVIPAAGVHTLKVSVVSESLNMRDMQISFPNVNFLDYDNDGMDDRWEVRQGGHLPPTGDPDGDRMSNVNEYLADTDPFSATSYFAEAISRTRTNTVLSVPITSTARYYAIHSATNLVRGPWRALGANLKGTGGALTWSDTSSPRNVYYRWLAAP